MEYQLIKQGFDQVLLKHGFTSKENGDLEYRGEDVYLLFHIEKDIYSNSIKKLGFGVNPYELLRNWDLGLPQTVIDSQIIIGLSNSFGLDIEDLEQMNEQRLKATIYEFDQYVAQLLPYILSVEELKTAIEERNLEVDKHVREYWGLYIYDVNLNYDIVYNGLGIEVDKMIQNYYGDKIKYIDSNKLVPTQPKEGDIVGVKYVYELTMDELKKIKYKYVVYITDVMSIHVYTPNDDKRYVSSLQYSDFMELNVEHSFAYAYRPLDLYCRMDYIDQGLNSIMANEPITKVKHELTYEQLNIAYQNSQSFKQTTIRVVLLILIILLACITMIAITFVSEIVF